MPCGCSMPGDPMGMPGDEDIERRVFNGDAAVSAAILALGIVYWLVRDQDRREAEAAALESADTRPP